MKIFIYLESGGSLITVYESWFPLCIDFKLLIFQIKIFKYFREDMGITPTFLRNNIICKTLKLFSKII